MDLIPLGIEGAWLSESPVWGDDRGSFREWFKRDEVLKKTDIDFPVNQANISISKKGVIRGIHYSLAPNPQAKWITCVSGSIMALDWGMDSFRWRKQVPFLTYLAPYTRQNSNLVFTHLIKI